MEFTENTDFETLNKAYLSAAEYGHRSMSSSKITRMFKKGARYVFHRVNTPDGIPVIYIFYAGKASYNIILVLRGREGESYAKFMANENDGKSAIEIIYSHAINRYIERHGFNGSKEECLKHIMLGTEVQCMCNDKITDERKIYFDGGCFLGCQNGNIIRMRTFIMNRQMYPGQRMDSLKSEKRTDYLLKVGKKQVMDVNGRFLRYEELTKK